MLHLELSIRGSGMAYEPGDSIGVLPLNPPDLVAGLCKRLSVSPDKVGTFKTRILHDSASPAHAHSVALSVRCIAPYPGFSTANTSHAGSLLAPSVPARSVLHHRCCT